MTHHVINSGKNRKGVFIAFFLIAIFTLLPMISAAQNNMLFFEAQGVAGYGTATEEWQFYSHHPHEAMQKPSLGFDYVGRIGGRSKDLGYFAVQARLAYDENESKSIQPQLYNAFFNWKAPIVDIWVGHNKTAIGLSSYLDNHALLLKDNSMSGLNFDRDWGAGINYDGDHFNLSTSATTGSGMPLYVGENRLFAIRGGFGDLVRDNFTIGISGAEGKILKSMGYEVMHNNKKHDLLLGGLDTGFRYLNLELKSDLLYGEYDGERAYAVLKRLSLFLLPEERAALEVQSQFTELKNDANQYFSAGLSYRITPDLTLRSTYTYHYPGEHHTVVLQAYFYKGIVF
ncbi:MAG: hypothetical protein Q8J62_05140 [Candidatus Cloacimonadaceae bacterium]|nr:hypothetical protein [Candidatus Cloacimonadaceae bacterium]